MKGRNVTGDNLHAHVKELSKECVAVLNELYKKNVSVLCVGSHCLSDN